MASRSWNRVELIGNLTRDIEMRYTPSGTAVATFSIATNRTFVTDGEKREEADFHRCVAWNKLAELCQQLLKKGNRVFVSGRLQNRSWQTPEGQTKYITEIVIEDMILLTNKEFGGDYSASEDPGPPAVVPSRNADEMPKDRIKDQGSRIKDENTESAKKPEKEEVEDIDDLPF